MSITEENHKALDLFGELLMQQVRDTQIKLWDDTIAGDIKARDYKQIHDNLSQTFDAEQLQILHDLVPWIVDNVIAHFLGMLEEQNEIDLAVHVDGQTVPSLRQASDGLEAALYSEDGWIARFSKQRLPNPF